MRNGWKVRAGVVALGVAATALLAGACGGGGSERASDQRVDTVAPPPTSDLERERGLEAFEAAEDERHLEDCRAVATAFTFVHSHESMRPHLTDTALRDEWEAEEERLLAAVPPGLVEDLRAMKGAARAYTEALGPGWIERVDDPGFAATVRAAEDAYATDETLAASEAIEQYLLSCPEL